MTASWSGSYMVQPNTSVVRGRLLVGQWQAPLGSPRGKPPDHGAVCRRARVGQGQACGGAEEAPSLTLAARDGDANMPVGAEECSRRGSNKRMNKQGREKMVCTTLDIESPIQALLAEAYDCFMVGILHGSTEYKRGSRAIARGQWQAPLGSTAWQTTRSRAVCRRARVGQGQACGGAEEAPFLTLAARDGDANMRSGRKNARGAGRTKE
jgi:hypothetical protein